MATHLLEDAPRVLRQRKDEILQLVNKVCRKAAIAGGDYLARQTPVKRGVARSNWVMTNAFPFLGVIPAYSPFFDLGNDAAPIERFSEAGNLAGALSQHQSAAANFDVRKSRVLYLRNNTPYIGLLNYGRSKQNVTPNWFGKVTGVMSASVQGVWKLRP